MVFQDIVRDPIILPSLLSGALKIKYVSYRLLSDAL